VSGPAAAVRARGISALAAVTALIYAVAGFGLLSSATFYTEGKNPRWVLALLGCVAVGFVVVALVRGRRFTVGEAELMLVVELACTVWLTLGSHIDIAAFSNGVSLPLVSAYAGWFLTRRASAILYTGVLAWLGAVVARSDVLLGSIALTVALECIIGSEVARLVVGRLLRLSRTDSLTGVLNRMALEAAGHRLAAESARRGSPMSVAVIDLDDLRGVNNASGHAAGDSLLVRAARRWADGLPDATVGRIGGDEFVVLLPECAAADAERRLLSLAGGGVRWSAGVAELRPGESFDAVVERADRLMYNRKGSNAAALPDGGLAP
jgi:GGDEF domain-containing protein